MSRTLRQYLPLVLNDTELLTELKAIKLIEINNAYETAILSVQREHIPQTEMLSFETQERESKAYKNCALLSLLLKLNSCIVSVVTKSVCMVSNSNGVSMVTYSNTCRTGCSSS